MIYILAYLISIVFANWAVSRFGATISPWTALVFIGFVIYARDCLHDTWLTRNLKRNMFLLIATGSILSIPFNAGAIALASFLAFALSESVDTLVYHRLLRKPKLLRINGSNLMSAAVDSVAFLSLASWLLWGWPPPWGIMGLQFVAKVGGGFVWSLVIEGVKRGRLEAIG
jgi:uncharacterized PurR-regulated membrane protein YhhQ (DUF165 family)